MVAAMSVSRLQILALDGDGIGPEVTGPALAVLRTVAEGAGIDVAVDHAPFGGAAIDAGLPPLPPDVLSAAKASDAVLLGAVGGPKWDDLPSAGRPERGLLGLRAGLGAFANLRPATILPALAAASPLREDLAVQVDLLVVRELVGGIYFGEPRGRSGSGDERRGVNSMTYSAPEIRRIAEVALRAAGPRRGRLASIDKANVLDSMQLWREVVTEVAAGFPDVSLEHLYVDNAAMQMVRDPARFDVLVTPNLFGDILSDLAAALTGSIGLLPSASLGDGPGIYEPVHGSAPDIAGTGNANPLAAILSVAMLFDHTAKRPDLGDRVRGAVAGALADGLRTLDLYAPEGAAGIRRVGTDEMADAVLASLR